MCFLYTSFFSSAAERTKKSFDALKATYEPSLYGSSFYAARAFDEVLVHTGRTLYYLAHLAALTVSFVPLALISPCGVPMLLGAWGFDALSVTLAAVATVCSLAMFLLRGACTVVAHCLGHELDESENAHDDERFNVVCAF
jgi:hypothetical protein